jgi:hypothetical protein
MYKFKPMGQVRALHPFHAPLGFVMFLMHSAHCIHAQVHCAGEAFDQLKEDARQAALEVEVCQQALC